MSATILILTHHSDPGHGWIEVPAVLIDRLGILDQISEYSYYSHDSQKYYLEEDGDAATLFKALETIGQEFVTRSKDHPRDAFIRRLARVGGE